MQIYGTPVKAEVLHFLKVDLMQKIWLLMLNEDFVDAYACGTLITCSDGVKCQIFPQIFTYAADYPEK
jgi:hypothetical protein